MKRWIMIICFGCVSVIATAQSKDFIHFIPRGYDTLDEGVVRGDLNKDGIEDLALVLFHSLEITAEKLSDSIVDIPERILLVLFGSENGYKLAARTDSLILCKDCGGAMGDPFAGIEIKKGVLVVYHYGGSSWRWSFTHRFRYQDGDFYMIGKTRDSFRSVDECEKLGDFAGRNLEDINYLTGQFERKRVSEDCKLLENKKGKMKVSPLVKLSKASID
jgi:hypothetical protein